MAFTAIVNFDYLYGYPASALISDAAGDLFGVVHSGGASGVDTVFEIANTPSGYASTPVTVISFSGSAAEGLIIDSAGDLFGTTYTDSSSGTVFEIAKTGSGYANTLTTLVSFNDFDGALPGAGLTTDAAGDLFGTTLHGGTYGFGTVFEIAKTASGYASTPTTLVNFDGYSGNSPYAVLTADAAGDLFGELSYGPNGGDGTVFEIVKSANGYASTPVTLVTFNGTDGAYPYGGLIFDAAGDLFGTASTVFEIVKTATGYADTPTTLVSFNGTDGSSPMSGVIADAAGDLFGTTFLGGANDQGTVFEVFKTASGYASTPTTLAIFYAPDVGAYPSALLVDAEGDLFGTTVLGGADNEGTVFELNEIGYQVACYLRGTCISTPLGAVPVEALATGDLVLTASGAAQPILWIGRCCLDARRHPRPAEVWPVRVSASAFGDKLPCRDLWLSPDHAIFYDGVLIPIRCLINGATIAQEQLDAITYYHLELPAHDVILAEGLPAESYLDTGNRAAFTAGTVAHLHPTFGRNPETIWQELGCAPLVQSGPAIEVARARLAVQAAALGAPCAPEVVLRLTCAGQASMSIPPEVRTVRLASPTITPKGDRRSLGVAINDLALDGVPLRLDDPRLARGFHAIEGAAPRCWRWTNGDGVLEFQPDAAARLLELNVVSVLSAAAA